MFGLIHQEDWPYWLVSIAAGVAAVLVIVFTWRRKWEALGTTVGIVLVLAAALAPALILKTAFEDSASGRRDECEPTAVASGPAAPNTPADGTPPADLAQLETNEARPTLSIAVADRGSASDSITFTSKGRTVVKPPPKAVLLEAPRRAPAEPIDSAITLKTATVAGGTAVRLNVCVDRGEVLKAGQYQGTVRLFGPRVIDFDYALIVTQKWPWQTAFAVLWWAGLVFIVAALLTSSLTFDPARKGLDKWLASIAGATFALFAMVPAFFGAYWNNATWGSDPGPHVLGLATAGFTAALAGLATAQKFIKKPTPEERVNQAMTEVRQQASQAGVSDATVQQLNALSELRTQQSEAHKRAADELTNPE
jgi:hypothetical protein